MEVHPFSTYKTYEAAQHPNVWTEFEKLLLSNNFSLIVEIGTQKGGFTEFMYDFCLENNLNYNLISFDVRDKFNKIPRLLNKGVNVVIKNIFDFNRMILIDESTHQLIYNEKGKVLILCDGGNKSKEFNILSKYLKRDDVIMAHDWAYDSSFFNNEIKDKIWNWHEIEWKDVSESVTKNDLIFVKNQNWDFVCWLCMIKNNDRTHFDYVRYNKELI